MASKSGNRGNISMAHVHNWKEEEDEEESCRLAMQLASSSVLPMVLKAAIELDLLEVIKKAEPGPNASASELASQLPTNNPAAAAMIDRILRFLAVHSILTCTLRPLQDGSGLERRYSLRPVCKFLTKNEDGVSLAPCFSLLDQDRVCMEMWYHLKDAILEGGIPFNRAHGMSAFEYTTLHPRFNELFNRAMSEPSIIFMKKILENYKGFEGLKSLADVGGGIGTSLKMILSKYPSIRGINFDLPHVIQDATSYPGVEHIGGDMFVSVPKADAIFMKWICHNWSDEHCKKLLKNCYEALPENGKLIVADTIFPDDTDSGPAHTWAAQFDLLMLSFTAGGKERAEKEFHALSEYAGFRRVVKFYCGFEMWIIEFHK